MQLLDALREPGPAWLVLTVAAQVVPAPSDWVGFSGPAMLVVSTLLSIMSGVVTFQARQLDKEREARLKDRDLTITKNERQIEDLERRIEVKDEQIFRLLGLGERATSALDALAPVARSRARE